MEKRLPHITAEMEHQSFRDSWRSGFSSNGSHGAGSATTPSRTPDARRRQEEEEIRKHREELAQIGPNVIG